MGQMPMRLGKTLLVANPVAHNGKAAEKIECVRARLASLCGRDSLDVELTNAPGHASDIAAHAGSFDSLVALGGDGVVHEVANGLMRLPKEDRPALGLIPYGSGNDYARTLGMSLSFEDALRQLGNLEAHPVDLGLCNGTYFTETLSFGLDAAIALDTVERRKTSRLTGTLLYMASGKEQLLHHRVVRPFTIAIDDAPVRETSVYLMAVQNGRTYGGGFDICPDAETDDGILDLCMVHPPLTTLGGVYTFLRAKNAHHVGMKGVEFARARRMRIVFEEMPPCQMDGEKVEATSFDIAAVSHALTAWFAKPGK